MRDIGVIDSELRTLAVARRAARELTGRTPSSALIDDLLDERDQVKRTLDLHRGARSCDRTALRA